MNKIFVTQGHEKGIGLEVFFKSILFLDPKDIKAITLVGTKDSIKDSLENLKLSYNIKDNSIELVNVSIKTHFLKKSKTSESLGSLDYVLKHIQENDILFTLPTSKDQLGKHAGHTEYFRSHFNKQDLGMFFYSDELKILLLTDHIPLKSVSDVLTTASITSKINTALNSLKKANITIERVLVAGINPHAGEKGIIGKEDSNIETSLRQLKTKHKISFSGPYPADTIMIEKKSNQDLLVFMYHDQGLGIFKTTQGFIGSNITLGLPFLRISPDHGTSFALYGKNIADYRGCLFSLKSALRFIRKE